MYTCRRCGWHFGGAPTAVDGGICDACFDVERSERETTLTSKTIVGRKVRPKCLLSASTVDGLGSTREVYLSEKAVGVVTEQCFGGRVLVKFDVASSPLEFSLDHLVFLED